MAIVQSFDQDKDKPEQGSVTPTIAGGITTGTTKGENSVNKPVNVSGSAATGQGVVQPGNAANTGAATQSGRYTNLKQYVDANKTPLGQRIVGDIGSKAEDVSSNINKDVEQFKSQAQANTPAYDQDLVNRVTSDPQNASAADRAAFTKMRDAQYKGPTQLENLSTLQQQVTNLKGLTDLGQDNAGRYALLQKLYGTPNYTKGAQKLDNLLLQIDPNQVAQLNQLGSYSSSVANRLQEEQQKAADLAQVRKEQASFSRAKASADVGQAMGGIQSQASQNLANIAPQAEQKQAEINALSSALQSGTLTSDMAKKLGIDTGAGRGFYQGSLNTYGVDPSTYLNVTPMQGIASLQSTISKADAAKINALANLMGQGDVYDVNTAGTFSGPAYSFDPTQLMAAIQSAKNTYNTNFQNAIDPYQKQLDQYNQELYKLQMQANQQAAPGVGQEQRGAAGPLGTLQNIGTSIGNLFGGGKQPQSDENQLRNQQAQTAVQKQIAAAQTALNTARAKYVAQNPNNKYLTVK